MKQFRVALACVVAFAFTAALSAAPKNEDDDPNPFKMDLEKIAKLWKENKEPDGDKSFKKSVRKNKNFVKAMNNLSKKQERLIAQTKKEIAKLEKRLERLEGQAGQEEMVEKVTKELEAKREYLKNIYTWADIRPIFSKESKQE